MLPCTRLSPAVWVYSLVTISLAASSAVVHQNGYNNVLVALSEDLFFHAMPMYVVARKEPGGDREVTWKWDRRGHCPQTCRKMTNSPRRDHGVLVGKADNRRFDFRTPYSRGMGLNHLIELDTDAADVGTLLGASNMAVFCFQSSPYV